MTALRPRLVFAAFLLLAVAAAFVAWFVLNGRSDRVGLPSGVFLVNGIDGADREDCAAQSEFTLIKDTANGDAAFTKGLVHACLALENRAGRAVKVSLPAGAVFRSEDPDVQDGLLIGDVSIELAKGETRKVFLDLICLNADRRRSAKGDRFTLDAELVYDAKVMQIVNLLRDAKLDSYAEFKVLQNSVWYSYQTEGSALHPNVLNMLRRVANERIADYADIRDFVAMTDPGIRTAAEN